MRGGALRKVFQRLKLRISIPSCRAHSQSVQRVESSSLGALLPFAGGSLHLGSELRPWRKASLHETHAIASTKSFTDNMLATNKHCSGPVTAICQQSTNIETERHLLVDMVVTRRARVRGRRSTH